MHFRFVFHVLLARRQYALEWPLCITAELKVFWTSWLKFSSLLTQSACGEGTLFSFPQIPLNWTSGIRCFCSPWIPFLKNRKYVKVFLLVRHDVQLTDRYLFRVSTPWTSLCDVCCQNFFRNFEEKQDWIKVYHKTFWKARAELNMLQRRWNWDIAPVNQEARLSMSHRENIGREPYLGY